MNQLEKDEDVVAQAQAITSLESLPQLSFSVINALNSFLNNSKVQILLPDVLNLNFCLVAPTHLNNFQWLRPSGGFALGQLMLWLIQHLRYNSISIFN